MLQCYVMEALLCSNRTKMPLFNSYWYKNYCLSDGIQKYCISEEMNENTEEMNIFEYFSIHSYRSRGQKTPSRQWPRASWTRSRWTTTSRTAASTCASSSTPPPATSRYATRTSWSDTTTWPPRRTWNSLTRSRRFSTKRDSMQYFR